LSEPSQDRIVLVWFIFSYVYALVMVCVYKDT
jgi:hypothetical protein